MTRSDAIGECYRMREELKQRYRALYARGVELASYARLTLRLSPEVIAERYEGFHRGDR